MLRREACPSPTQAPLWADSREEDMRLDTATRNGVVLYSKVSGCPVDVDVLTRTMCVFEVCLMTQLAFNVL